MVESPVDLAVRSGLVLKLLTHVESGAIAAAPTTSLPEDIGGVRNWDYRYSWVRDAGFTIQALMNLGHVGEATDYFDWFLDLCHVDEPADVRPLYGLHGDVGLDEQELDPETGSHLGNHPQAFSHIGLINSALYVGFAEGREMPGPEPMGVRLGDPVVRKG